MFRAKRKLISLLTACMALVLMLVMGVATMSIQPKVASAADTTIVFNLGADGSAEHADGTSKTTYTETVDGYTLTLSNVSNFYTGARDAKGNSCIKLGASSKAGGFSFTAPSDVTSVIIEVGKYKSNTTKVTIAGTTHTLTKNSNDGAYDAITVDTTSNKTVIVTTVSGGYRAMVNTITFVIPAASGGECAHSNLENVSAKEATCSNEGNIEYWKCSECEKSFKDANATEEATEAELSIEKLAHTEVTIPAVDKTCTTDGATEGKKCSVCDTVITAPTKIPAGHTYVEGICSVCGAKEPTINIYTLTFDANKANRDFFSTTKQVWSQNGVVFTNNKSASTTNVADYGAPVRLYANSEITVECAGMTQIVFDCNSNDYATALKNSIGASATASSDKVTVIFASAQDSFTVAKLNAQVRLDSLTVTVESSNDGDCVHTNLTFVEEVPATCTEKGQNAHYTCECGKLFADENAEEEVFENDLIIDTIAHTEVVIPAIEKTCTTNGKTEGKKCSVCGTVTEEQTTIPAGHNFADGECTVCGEEQPMSAILSFETTDARVSWDANQQIWAQNGISFTNKKGSGNNIIDSSNPVRLYKGSEISIVYTGMIKIEFNCNTTDYANDLKSAIDENVTVNEKVVTVVFTEVINEFTVTLSVGQVRLDSITVYSMKKPSIESASVTLGDDVALNYYVTMSEGFEATMNFTMNGETYDRELTKDGERYKVSLELPPQYMATEISVELIVNGVVVETMTYSVKQYAQSMLNDAGNSDKLKRLVSDMLYYGAAAQVYRGYNVENLATDDVTNLVDMDLTVNPVEADNVRMLTSHVADKKANFKSVSVWFDDVNKIYVKVNTQNANGATVTLKILKGETVEKEVAVTSETVFTEGILATDFDKTYTFELYVDGELTQTLTYSVNAYAYKMKDHADMGELALALYRYGKSAEAYKG